MSEPGAVSSTEAQKFQRWGALLLVANLNGKMTAWAELDEPLEFNKSAAVDI